MKFFHSLKNLKPFLFQTQRNSICQTQREPIFPPIRAGIPIAGYVDNVSSSYISGWCVHLSNPKEELQLDLIVGDQILVSAPIYLPREDISSALGRQTRAGFRLHIGKALAAKILERQSQKPGSDNIATRIPFQISVSTYDVLLPSTPQVELTMARHDLESLARGEHFNVQDPFRIRFERRKEAAESALIAHEPLPVRLIAFYLPQYHPFPENNEWWGEGFTDWTNVVKAKPHFPGHYQPHLPADLGFYDLRMTEVREHQAQLAREYGIHGFCYHYYWFAGRTLMDTPIRAMLESGKPDFPFCICWANEPWSRRWDGSEHEVLLAQPHEIDSDERFILDIMPFLKDARYIRIDGAPLIIIYRVSLLPDAPELFRRWRAIAASHGIFDLHIVMAQTFGLEEPHGFGCDAAVEFPPHRLVAPEITETVLDEEQKEPFNGKVYDYRDVVSREITKKTPEYVLYRGIFPSWDNTARRGAAGHVFHYSSPEYYEIWLRALIHQTKQNSPPDQRFVFINAWNEWAEGAHLEPDREHGRCYLEATLRTISDKTSADSELRQLELAYPGNKTIEKAIDSLRIELAGLRRANRYLTDQFAKTVLQNELSRAQWLKDIHFDKESIAWDSNGLLYNIDRINQYPSSEIGPELVLARHETLGLVGWLFVKGFNGFSIHTYIVAQHEEGENLIVFLRHRFDRPDVNAAHPGQVQMLSGFEVLAPCMDMVPGRYDLSFMVTNGSIWKRASIPFTIQVI